MGTSPGKAAVGLRVVDEQTGAPIGAGAALKRSLVLGVATLPTIGIGVATLAWTALMDTDRKRRGWHDHVAGSVVIDVRPVVVEEEEAPERPRHIVNLTAMRLVPASPTPPREVPARVRRSRWAAGGTGTPTPEPAPGPAEVTPAAPVETPAAVAAAAPVATPAAASPAAAAHPDALATPSHAAPAAPRRPDPLSDPLSDDLVEPTRPRGGAPRHAAPAAPAAAAPEARPVWSVAFDTGEEFTVEGFTLVGRNPEPRSGEPVRRVVALPSQDMSLSKTHAQFQVVPDGALVVMDRGSTNGSILIRGGVPRELGPGKPAALKDGDRVRFGDREMRVTRVS
jgi:predicted component of type VI protein secretion system